ncbi:MAG TPA: hypothetical protein VLI04_14990 [Nocardioidaceae bacterium]|nr:hypothetical protein [Nocardioidaceae bacterium]
MGVSAVGQTGIRPRTFRLLFVLAWAVAIVMIYLLAPAVVPGLQRAAEDKCNVMNGGNYRSFKLEWVLPQPPNWDRPHWLCKDRRDLDKPGVSFGWWVNPFKDYKEYPEV